MIGCFVAVVAIVIGLALLPFIGTFITTFFADTGFTFTDEWSLLEGVIGLMAFSFLILIFYAAIKSVRG